MSHDLARDFDGTFPHEARFVQAGDVRIHYVEAIHEFVSRLGES